MSRWRITTSGGKVPFQLLCGDCLIAEIAPCATVGSGFDDDQVLAMIETAPELLAALSELISHETSAINGSRGGQAGVACVLGAFDRARAAITKARNGREGQ